MSSVEDDFSDVKTVSSASKIQKQKKLDQKVHKKKKHKKKLKKEKKPPSPGVTEEGEVPQEVPPQEEGEVPPQEPVAEKGTVTGDGNSDDIANATLEELFERLGATTKGLTSSEVENRVVQYGLNQLEEKTQNPILKFLTYFWNPLSWTMEFAAVLAFILGDYVDTIVICALLILNACIGFWEEHSSGNAIKALQSSLAPNAKALRDGEWKEIPAFELVPGDIVHLTLGNLVPADVKLIAGENVKIDQSALTGESEAVSKHEGDEMFSGTTVKQGDVTAIVYATGKNTFFGKAVDLVQNTEAHGHFQMILKQISYFCIIFIAIFVALELIIQFAARRKSCGGLEWYGQHCVTLMNTLVIIVGGIPIAMPTVLSVTMALGAAELAKKKAFVARLTAVEVLAGMDVLCSDKTGTLTLNQLTVKEPVVVGDADPEMMMTHAALATQRITPDAIDKAMLATVDESRLNMFEELKHSPFDPVGKKAISKVKDKETGDVFWTCKGAPQVILKESDNREDIEDEVNEQIADCARRGFRTIGVAIAHTEGVWHMEGLVPLYDPPREDTAETIKIIQEYGIQVKMITGDQKAIAEETCRLLGLETDILLPDTLDTGENDERLQEVGAIVEKASGFAQVFPEHKYKIVEILQKMKHIVGMTGDGVNDAPALQVSDIGIAVDGATDAARGAADIVLSSPGLHVITEAIFGSREIFQRMQSYTLYSITTTVRIVLTFSLLTLIFDFSFPTILIAIVAVLNDGTIMAISKDRVRASQYPDDWNLPRLFFLATLMACMLVLSTLILYLIVNNTRWFEDWFNLPRINNFERIGLIYLNVSISGQAMVFLTRSRSWFFWCRFPSIFLIIAFVVAQTIATVIAIFGFNGYPFDNVTNFTGCGWNWALLAWIWSIITVLLVDPVKVLMYWLFKKIKVVKKKWKKRKLKRYGNPVYGNYNTAGFGLTTVWPGMTMEQPGPEQLMETAGKIKRASLADIEIPWSSLEQKFVDKKDGGTSYDWHALRDFAKMLEDEENYERVFKRDSTLAIDIDEIVSGDLASSSEKGKEQVGKKKKHKKRKHKEIQEKNVEDVETEMSVETSTED